MSELTAKRFIVSGTVQGVFFRASTRQQALQLDIRGYAKNLANGSVEVFAIGSSAAIAILERWLWQGPSTARVNDVIAVTEFHSGLDSHVGFATL